jgi:hypothetical protein
MALQNEKPHDAAPSHIPIYQKGTGGLRVSSGRLRENSKELRASWKMGENLKASGRGWAKKGT